MLSFCRRLVFLCGSAHNLGPVTNRPQVANLPYNLEEEFAG